MRTERQYVQWARRFILFHGKRHPVEMGTREVEAFLTHLAVAGKVAAATQNQALSALLFLCREVLGQDLPWLDEGVRAKRPARLPVVLTRRGGAGAGAHGRNTWPDGSFAVWHGDALDGMCALASEGRGAGTG
jgi:hypothetical protein